MYMHTYILHIYTHICEFLIPCATQSGLVCMLGLDGAGSNGPKPETSWVRLGPGPSWAWP